MASNLAYSNALENYVADSNECVKFKLVTCPEDLEEDFVENDNPKGKQSKVAPDPNKYPTRIPSFKPDMSYQFFGENENIFGYKNLCVKLYYSCAKLNIYLGLRYSSMVNKDKTGGVAADDVMKAITSDFETTICTNLSEFSAALAKEKSFVPYGEVMEEFAIDYTPEEEQPYKRHFQIYKANSSVAGFSAYHERMQTFLKFYIEAASYVDIDDERWEFFTIYEKLPLNNCKPTTSSRSDKVPLDFQYCFVGYCSLYRFYAYPNNIRPRISQFLILPPFQRLGLGTKMLQFIYSHFNDKSTVDIQVEDPSENFQLMRDILDCKLCAALKSFSADKLKQGWSKEMATEAREKYKMTTRQARRVYEILRLKLVDRTNPVEYRAYRVKIKQRFNAPYQKQILDLEKAKRKISESEYAALMKSTHMPRDLRIDILAKQYEALEKEYLAVIEKLP